MGFHCSLAKISLRSQAKKFDKSAIIDYNIVTSLHWKELDNLPKPGVKVLNDKVSSLRFNFPKKFEMVKNKTAHENSIERLVQLISLIPLHTYIRDSEESLVTKLVHIVFAESNMINCYAIQNCVRLGKLK